MAQNELVDFLAAYGPTSDGNNMYDEFVVAAAANAGVDPIAIPETRSNEILNDLIAEQPRSVILTGTAGDGKTYTARKVLEALSGNAATWGNTQETYEWVDSKAERRICQRRSKSRPLGGAKVGHLALQAGNVGRA